MDQSTVNATILLPMRQLEIHVVHSCNLTCESCSHYSNQGHKGMLGLETADRWLAGWSRRLKPTLFKLVGGEPTLHPELSAMIRLARHHWPHSHMSLATNGFFLHRHPELPRALHETRTVLSISQHHQSPEYLEKIQQIVELVQAWKREHDIAAEIVPSYRMWTRRYRGTGATMEPYEDGQPRQSWTICPAKWCAQLYLGNIWKCAALAYLGMQHERYHLSEKWADYLRYKALEPGCSDDELREFLGREEESCCGMCPAVAERFELPSPLLPLRMRGADKVERGAVAP